jgi:hypothetical protein
MIQRLPVRCFGSGIPGQKRDNHCKIKHDPLKKFRKWIPLVFPAIVLVLLAGLLLSRVYRPVPAEVPQVTIESSQAAGHIGTTAEVCGRVTSADFAPHIGGEPTFLNFGEPFPRHHFTVVIWGESLHRWDVPPHRLYADRDICVTGTIREHRDKPQIVVSEPGNIRFRIR